MKKLATILLIAAFGTVALAHSGVKNEAVMKRMALMTSIAERMKVVGTMAKGQATFDVEKSRAALTEISQKSARIPHLFKTRADDPKSEAQGEGPDPFGPGQPIHQHGLGRVPAGPQSGTFHEPARQLP